MISFFFFFVVKEELKEEEDKDGDPKDGGFSRAISLSKLLLTRICCSWESSSPATGAL